MFSVVICYSYLKYLPTALEWLPQIYAHCAPILPSAKLNSWISLYAAVRYIDMLFHCQRKHAQYKMIYDTMNRIEEG